MPGRPRAHELEVESKNALRSAIPSNWVFRELDQDYGIDGEIEVFDENGFATGIKFLVQLKATDQKDLRRSLRVWFPFSQGNYFHSLEQPVLIVRYLSASNDLYVRWFHSFNRNTGNKNSKGISFKLRDGDLWTDQTVGRILDSIEAYRELRSPKKSGPTSFDVFLDNFSLWGIRDYQLKSRLVKLVSPLQDILQLRFVDSVELLGPNAISVSERKLEIKIAECNGVTIENPEGGYAAAKAEESLHCDIISAVALAFDYFGHSLPAARMIAVSWRGGSLSKNPEFAGAFARCLARANQIHVALEIAQEYSSLDEGLAASQIFFLPFHLGRKKLGGAEYEFAIRAYKRMAKLAVDQGNVLQAAVHTYNCANILKELGRYREAVRKYRSAANLDPEYLEREYWWREIAGCLFSSNKYSISEKCYQRAVEIESREDTQLLWADALLFSGKYNRAYEKIDANIEGPIGPNSCEWSLKKYCVGFLMDFTGIVEQVRTSPAFPDNFGAPNVSWPEIKKVCGALLSADALCGLAWYNLGQSAYGMERFSEAANYFLVAAIINVGDLEAWGNAYALFSRVGESEMCIQILVSAYYRYGQEFVSHLAERYPEDDSEFAAILERTLNQLPFPEDHVVIRHFSSQTEWDEVVVRN